MYHGLLSRRRDKLETLIRVGRLTCYDRLLFVRNVEEDLEVLLGSKIIHIYIYLQNSHVRCYHYIALQHCSNQPLLDFYTIPFRIDCCRIPP